MRVHGRWSLVLGFQPTVRGLRLTLLGVLLGMATAAPGLATSEGVATNADARIITGERPAAPGTIALPVPPPALPWLVASGDVLAAEALPADAVPWASLPAPPGLGGAMVQGGGGGGPTFEYYALDALGSVRVVFDAAGAVRARADYEPFGAAVTASTTGLRPRGQFTSQQRDSEVGLDYFGARFYHATHGRMLSVDPLYVGAVADPQRWNRYAYALNSPVVVTDPDGRTPNPSLCTPNIVALNPADYHCNGFSGYMQPSQFSYGGGNADYEALTFPGGFGYRIEPTPCGGLTACSPGSPAQGAQQSSGTTSTTTNTTNTTTTTTTTTTPNADIALPSKERPVAISLHPGMRPIYVTRAEADEYYRQQQKVLALLSLAGLARFGVAIDGPSKGLPYLNGRLVGVRLFRNAIRLRLDVHPLGTQGRPVLHFNAEIGPLNFHLPLAPGIHAMW